MSASQANQQGIKKLSVDGVEIPISLSERSQSFCKIGASRSWHRRIQIKTKSSRT
jgi:hypothetical protein